MRTIPLAILLFGCVPTYSQKVTAAPPSPSLPWMSDKPYDVLNANFQGISKYCDEVFKAMGDEIDSIKTRNNAIGAAFAAVTAGLSAANGLYSALAGDKADHTVTTILGFGATGTAVPTFFYLGSEKRETEVQQRLSDAKAKLEAVYTARDTASKEIANLNHIKDLIDAARDRIAQIELGAPPTPSELDRIDARIKALAPGADRSLLDQQKQNLVKEADDLREQLKQREIDLTNQRFVMQQALMSFDVALSRLLDSCK